MTSAIGGRRVLVTGGTGSVGREVVRVFSELGCAVTFQFQKNLDGAKALEKSYGAVGIQMDFTEGWRLLTPDYDIVVNNAGVNVSRDLTHELRERDITTTLAVNLLAPLHIARQSLPGMVARGWGRIVNTCSIYGHLSSDRNTPYVISKHGLSGLTKAIAREYAPWGITCNEVCPGAIESALIDRIAALQEPFTGVPKEEYLTRLRDSVPDRRLAAPEEVAAAIAYLASDQAAHVNGTSLRLDGGATA